MLIGAVGAQGLQPEGGDRPGGAVFFRTRDRHRFAGEPVAQGDLDDAKVQETEGPAGPVLAVS